MSTVTAIQEGFSNSALRMPYALAELSCGHVAGVRLRDTRGVCCGCGAGLSYSQGSSFQRCACGTWMAGNINSPNPHKAEDRLTKMGDVMECERCAAEAAQLEWLRALDMSTVHHTRERYGSIYLYRLEPTSPSNFMLIGSVAPTPANEALLRGRLAPLSPTEQA